MAAIPREGKGEPRPAAVWVALGAAVATASTALLHHLVSSPPTPARVPVRQPGDSGAAWDTFEEAEAVAAVRIPVLYLHSAALTTPLSCAAGRQS